MNNDEFELLTDIASNLTSFSDTEVATINVAYQIEVVSPNSCGASESGRINQNSISRSNIARSNNVLEANSMGIWLEIYPNPTYDYLNINSSFDRLVSYELLTLTGQIVQVGELIGKGSISMKDISSGVYLLRVNSNGGSTVTRIVKK